MFCFFFLIFQLKSLPLYARWISDLCQFAQQLMSTESIYWLYKGIQKKIHLMYCQKGTTLLPPEKKGLIYIFFIYIYILNILYLTYPNFLNNFEKMSICWLGRLNEWAKYIPFRISKAFNLRPTVPVITTFSLKSEYLKTDLQILMKLCWSMKPFRR